MCACACVISWLHIHKAQAVLQSLRSINYRQWHVNQEKRTEYTMHWGAAGTRAVATCPPLAPACPARFGFRGLIWVAGSGGGEEVTWPRESPVLPPPARAAAVSRVRGGDARRVWLRDSRGGGPGAPRSEQPAALGLNPPGRSPDFLK